MARTAATRTHYIPAGSTVTEGTTHVDYVIEMRQGQVRWTAGRIMGSIRNGRGTWAALPVGADAWTAWHPTRAAAAEAAARREDFRLVA